MSDDTKLILKHIDERLSRSDKRSDEKFDKIDQKFDKIDEKFDKIDDNFEKLEKKIDEVDKKADDRLIFALEQMDDKFSVFLENVETLVDNKLKPVIEDINELKTDMKVVKAVVTDTNLQVQDHEDRIIALEQQPA